MKGAIVGSQTGLLELAGLRRKFGDVLALDGLSFTGTRLKVRQVLRAAA